LQNRFSWPVPGWDEEKKVLTWEPLEFIFPILKSEKASPFTVLSSGCLTQTPRHQDKAEEDAGKPESEWRPSIWRDWEEMKAIMDGARHREDEPGSVKTMHVRMSHTQDKKTVTDTFREHPILLLLPPILQDSGHGFDQDDVKWALTQKATSRVPVHGE
jgi:hypothetical protein